MPQDPHSSNRSSYPRDRESNRRGDLASDSRRRQHREDGDRSYDRDHSNYESRRSRGDRGYDREPEADSNYRRDRNREEPRGGRSDVERSYRPSERERDSRGGSSRRSASPQPRASRPHSASRPQSGSRSHTPEDKAKPNFAPSGLLAAATKTVKHADGTSTVLKYHEPPEARKPTVGWRLYVFKGAEQVDLLHIHRQSAYLIGRDRTVADLPIEHPSCSKQHAVIQFRQVYEKNEFGDAKAVIKPFIIDLESTNGTQVNDELIPASRYFELKLSDVIKFGESTREYVLLSDDAA